MIGRLLLTVLVAIGTAEVLKPIGRRFKWSSPVILIVSFLTGIAVALVVNAVVFG